MDHTQDSPNPRSNRRKSEGPSLLGDYEIQLLEIQQILDGDERGRQQILDGNSDRLRPTKLFESHPVSVSGYHPKKSLDVAVSR